jgi:hypothetical protein
LICPRHGGLFGLGEAGHDLFVEFDGFGESLREMMILRPLDEGTGFGVRLRAHHHLGTQRWR